MAKSQSPAKLKFDAPLGRMPVLQFLPPAELAVDQVYQRSADNLASQALIRRIATKWDWDLCLPLVVARRMVDGAESYFVIDGQHRLEAAKLRRDIAQLPCVVLTYSDVTREAANFVKLNQQRKPLTRLDVFKAAIASGDEETCSIVQAMADAGLTIATHSNSASWRPGVIANIAGIEASWRKHGERATSTAFRALSQAFLGQQLLLAGTIFPGIAAVCGDEFKHRWRFTEDRLEKFITMLAIRSQDDWRKDIMSLRVDKPGISLPGASEEVLRAAWKRSAGAAPAPAETPPPVAKPVPAAAPIAPKPASPAMAIAPAVSMAVGPKWCDQCDRRVDYREAAACRDKHCKGRAAA